MRASVPDAIALHCGYPGKDLLPERLVRAALARAARTEAALMRSPAAGLPELQAWFASQVADAAPVGVIPPSVRDVLIVAGSQSGLSSIFRALVGPGQKLLIESPTAGARLGHRRRPRPLVGHDDGHVIYLRSLTKSVSPALRVAAVIARGPARERILADRAAETMYVSGVLQAAALDVVTQPGWSAHLRGMRQQLRARRDLLLDSVGAHAPQVHVGTSLSAG